MKIPRKLEVEGNERAYCWRSSLAAVMEMDPRDVPAFLEPDWFEKYAAWAHSLGWRVDDWCLCERCRETDAVDVVTGILQVDCGASYHHAIVVQDGKLFYDPADAGDHYYNQTWMRFTTLTKTERN